MWRLNELQKGEVFAGDSGVVTSVPPPWVDKEKIKRARTFAKKYFFSIFFAHLGSLVLGVHVPSMLPPLLVTGNSKGLVCLFRRYLSTLLHIWRWYEGDIWDENDSAHKSIMTVRHMHRNVADKLNRGPCIQAQGTLHMSQYDMALTQFSFVGMVVLFHKKLGIFCSREDLENFVHFWRGVGYLLGIDDRFNVCSGSFDDTVAVSNDIVDKVLKPAIANASEDSILMSRNIIKALSSFIAFLSWEAVSRFWHDIMGLTFNFKMGVYQWTGYILMKFTFGCLLRLALFHALFNNALRVTIRYVVSDKARFETQLSSRPMIESVQG